MNNINAIIAVIAFLLAGGYYLDDKADRKKENAQQVSVPAVPEPVLDPVVVVAPANTDRKVVIDTDFGTSENDNAQWLMVFDAKDLNLFYYVVTGMERFNGAAKMNSFILGNAQLNQAPVLVGAREDLSTRSPAVPILVDLLKSLTPGESIDYLVGGYQLTLVDLARYVRSTGETALLSRMKVYAIYEQWPMEPYTANNAYAKELDGLPWGAFYVDNYGFRANTLATQNNPSRNDLHNLLSVQSSIRGIYNQYPIHEAAYNFKAGDYIVGRYARGEYLEMFRSSGRCVNCYVVDLNDRDAFNRIAGEWERLKQLIINTVSQM